MMMGDKLEEVSKSVLPDKKNRFHLSSMVLLLSKSL